MDKGGRTLGPSHERGSDANARSTPCTTVPLVRWKCQRSHSRDVLTEILHAGASGCWLRRWRLRWKPGSRHTRTAARRKAAGGGTQRLPADALRTDRGPVKVRQPRVRDRRAPADGQRLRGCPAICARRVRSALIPWLVRGSAPGSSAKPCRPWSGSMPGVFPRARLSRLIAGARLRGSSGHWRSVTSTPACISTRLEDAENSKQCILVLMATCEGKKELIAVQDYRESTASWAELLRDFQPRAEPTRSWRSAMVRWASGRRWGRCFRRRVRSVCWLHKTMNVLNHLRPGHAGPSPAAADLDGRDEDGSRDWPFDNFVALHEAKYPKATACLTKDRAALLGRFSIFPAEHWKHLRTTNPIGRRSRPFVRHDRTKGNGSRLASLVMVFKFVARPPSVTGGAGWSRPTASRVGRQQVPRWPQEGRRLRAIHNI